MRMLLYISRVKYEQHGCSSADFFIYVKKHALAMNSFGACNNNNNIVA